jgi:hypothetical protein
MSAPAPRMTITTATLRGSGKANQDQVVVTDHAVAVLDGATSWLPQDPSRDGGWYAKSLAASLLPRLDADQPTPDVLADAIAEVRDRFGLNAENSPESTVTIARWGDRSLDVFVLGDSPAALFFLSSEPVVVRDDRLQAIGANARAAYRNHLRGGHGYSPDLRAIIAGVQMAEHEARNKAGGYWIAAADPDAAFQAITASFALSELSAVALLTDGASAAVDDYEHPRTWAELLPEIETRSLAGLLNWTHGLEETDPDGKRWPRAKPHDDKTVALIRPQA